MLYAGLDLACQESHVYVVAGKGQKVLSCRLATTREALAKVFAPLVGQGISVAVEAGGSTRWVHGHLLKLGVREVYVVNPNKLRLIAESRKKTDKVDAKLLAELYRLDGLPEPVHMPSPEAAQLRMLIKARTVLVEARSKLMNSARGFLRAQGVILPARWLLNPAHWPGVMEREELDEATRQVLSSYLSSMERLADSIAELEVALRQRNKQDQRVELLQTIPGVGPHSAAALVAAVDDIQRFPSGKHLASYCGLVPTVRNSGDREIMGHINRQGRSEVRRTFVQAAHVVVNAKSRQARPLQRWFDGVRSRRGYKTAVVALARKLITLAFLLLKELKPYDPTRLRGYA